MDEKAIHDIAVKVSQDTSFYIALVGLFGAVLGSLLVVLGNVLTQKISQRAEARQEAPRRKILRQMLEDARFADHWRKLDTLMHVIGADEATTTRMLVEIGARGSEDGQRLWTLAKFHPFEQTSS